jgi:hypothetical protein
MTQVEEDDNEDDSLHIKRGLGCEYINAQNETIFELTKSNGDESFFFIILDTPPEYPTKVKRQ